MNLAIIERDGVVNEALALHVRTVEEWRPLPGSLDAITRLNRAGYRVVVATRQPGVRRRHFTMEALNRIHERMHRQLAEYGGTIDAVFICLCLPKQDCECFKPRPSMLHEVAERLHVSLDGVPCISSAQETLETAGAAGARPMLVSTGKDRADRRDRACPAVIEVHHDLASAVDTLLVAN